MITKLITEITRKEIIKGVDNKFIHHKDYTADLKTKLGNIKDINSKNWYLDNVIGGTLFFKIKSATTNEFYKNEISFTDDYTWLKANFKFSEYDMKSKESQKELVKDVMYYFRNMIDNGDVLVNCNCKAFKMYGYQYQATQLNYITRKNKEKRPADIRNPKDRGSICKHLDVTLKNIAMSPVKEYLIEYLTNTFLSAELKRRYKIRDYFWYDYFKYLV